MLTEHASNPSTEDWRYLKPKDYCRSRKRRHFFQSSEGQDFSPNSLETSKYTVSYWIIGLSDHIIRLSDIIILSNYQIILIYQILWIFGLYQMIRLYQIIRLPRLIGLYWIVVFFCIIRLSEIIALFYTNCWQAHQLKIHNTKFQINLNI